MAVLCNKCVGENILEQHTIGFVIGPCEICGCVSCSRGSYRISESKFKQLKDGQIFTEKDLEIKKLKHQLELVSSALSECIFAAGILREDISELSGPEMLMFSEDVCKILSANNKAKSETWADVAFRAKLAETVYNAIRTEIPFICPWKSLDADAVQRIVDVIPKFE